MRIKPAKLTKGDKVGIVAPARRIRKKDLKYGIEILQKWGLSVVEGGHLYEESGYLAGTDTLRRSDLQAMVDDASIKAIFCARGGYGTTRIIDDIDFSPLTHNPKWIVGFSDITALHLHLFRLGLESVHATMPALFYNADIDAVESLKKVLFGNKVEIAAEPHRLNKYGMGKGEVVGGNLSLIVDSLGTASEVDTAGKILFIEEIDEYLYKLDKMIVHLKRAGKLAHLNGLVVGQLSSMKDTKIPFGLSATEIIDAHAQRYTYPVCYEFSVGHDPLNLAIPVGREATLKVEEAGVKLSFKK